MTIETTRRLRACARPRRERDIAAFRERRRQAADEARAEARERIARTGEPACVADALAALAHPGAAGLVTRSGGSSSGRSRAVGSSR